MTASHSLRSIFACWPLLGACVTQTPLGHDAALPNREAATPASHDAGASANDAAGMQSRALDAGGPPLDAADSASDPDQSATDGGITPGLACTIGVDSLLVAGVERAGYPPYAANDCALLYVASDGALWLREPGALSERVIADATERPARPSLAGPPNDPARLMAWESLRDQVVRVRFEGTTRSVLGNYHHSGQPRATSDAIALTAWSAADPHSDADILLYEPVSQGLTTISMDPGQQLFADVSPTQVVYSDFAEDPDQRFDDDGQDLANLVLVDRATHARQTLELTGKQAFPLFSDAGRIVYLSWALGHPEPKLSAYAIMSWDATSGARALLAQIETQPPYVRPSVYGSTVEWVERPFGADERLMRVQLQAAEPRVAFAMPGVHLYATASSRSATWLAASSATQSAPVLMAIPR